MKYNIQVTNDFDPIHRNAQIKVTLTPDNGRMEAIHGIVQLLNGGRAINIVQFKMSDLFKDLKANSINPATFVEAIQTRKPYIVTEALKQEDVQEQEDVGDLTRRVAIKILNGCTYDQLKKIQTILKDK